jgi:fatty-acyl-CoA synthase
MSNPLYAFPAACEQTLRALARYPERTAFSWPGGSITYRGATDMIGRIQSVFMQLGFAPGTRVAFLSANRADAWCASGAAQLSRFAITWLHPLGSLDDQLFQLEDSEAQMLVVDGATFRDRGGELAARTTGLKTVFTLGPASYGVDLLRAIEAAGSATARSFAGPDDIATLNYTGGTTGKSKGALRHHREYGGWSNAILAEFEIPDTPRYLTVAPISHVAGTKVLPTLMRGGTVHMLKGFDPEAVFKTIEREKINFTLFVPTMILRDAGSSRARQDRPLLARTAAVWRVRDVAEPAGRGHRADRAGVLAALRPDRMLSGVSAAQGRPRSQNAGAVFVLRIPDRRMPGQDSGQ